jgi:hypothetical protein
MIFFSFIATFVDFSSFALRIFTIILLALISYKGWNYYFKSFNDTKPQDRLKRLLIFHFLFYSIFVSILWASIFIFSIDQSVVEIFAVTYILLITSLIAITILSSLIILQITEITDEIFEKIGYFAWFYRFYTLMFIINVILTLIGYYHPIILLIVISRIFLPFTNYLILNQYAENFDK